MHLKRVCPKMIWINWEAEMRGIFLTVCGGVSLAVLAACAEVSMPDRTDGAAFFATNCASCHGANGQGNGKLATGLPVPPADLTRLTRDNGGTFPAARALSYIYGDPRNAHNVRVMPEFGGAMEEDLVPVEIDGIMTPTPRVLAGLLDYLKSIQVGS